MVPAMVRTAPEPTPYFFVASRRGFAQLGVRRQPEVVVGREVDDLLAVEGAHRPLLILQHTQLEVRAFLLQVVELVGEEGERVGASGGGCHESPRNKPTF